MTKRDIIDGCEDIIFKMRDRANELITKGDDSGYLAMFWINKWIKNKPTTGDEDYFEQTGKHRQVPLYVHPGNFAWAFNCSTEIGKDCHHSYGYNAIEKVYLLAGGKL
jgi:hypothetical protein